MQHTYPASTGRPRRLALVLLGAAGGLVVGALADDRVEHAARSIVAPSPPGATPEPARDTDEAAAEGRASALRIEIASLEELRRSAEDAAMVMLKETNALAGQLVELQSLREQALHAAPEPATAAIDQADKAIGEPPPAAPMRPAPETPVASTGPGDPLLRRITEIYREAAEVKAQIEALRSGRDSRSPQ